MTPFLGQVMLFAGNFAPRGWAMCDGQLLPISQYSALFSILGTMYGGDGVTTFALPDLRGRVALHAGHGPGLSDRAQGQKGGAETVTLQIAQLPSHNHAARATTRVGTTPNPQGGLPAAFGTTAPPLGAYDAGTPDAQLRADAVGHTGGGQPLATMPPWTALRFVIAVEGVYPSRG